MNEPIYLSGNFQPPESLVFQCPLHGCTHRRTFDTPIGFRHGIVEHFAEKHKTRVFFGGQRDRITSLSQIREKSRRLAEKFPILSRNNW